MNLPNTMTAKEGVKNIKFGYRELIQGSSATLQAFIKAMVTEFGLANLFGKILKQRSQALKDIAHPDSREDLNKTILRDLEGVWYDIHLIYNY